jgi:hypothetical protein
MAKRHKSTPAEPEAVRVTVDPPESAEDDDEDHARPGDNDIGDQGEYECTRCFSATITRGGATAGSIRATLVKSIADGAYDFHDVCDSESPEMQEIGCTMFSAAGAPRYGPLKGNEEIAAGGGFLYIQEFLAYEATNKSERQDVRGLIAQDCAKKWPQLSAEELEDLAADALMQFLTLPELAGRWAIAVYIAKGRGVEDFAAAQAEDARPFIRAGFSQVTLSQAKGWLYVTRDKLGLRSREEAAGTTLEGNIAGGSPAPSGLDKQLLEQLMRSGRGQDAMPAVRALVARGASVTQSHALHCCAANGGRMVTLLPELLQLGGDVNGRDRENLTPLMLAAQKVAQAEGAPDTTMLALMFASGADKELTDGEGKTALGHLRAVTRGLNDFRSTMLSQPRVPPNPMLEAMLMPNGGPTEADEAANEEGGAGEAGDDSDDY